MGDEFISQNPRLDRLNLIIVNFQLILLILGIIVALFIFFQIIKFKYFRRKIIYKRWW